MLKSLRMIYCPQRKTSTAHPGIAFFYETSRSGDVFKENSYWRRKSSRMSSSGTERSVLRAGKSDRASICNLQIKASAVKRALSSRMFAELEAQVQVRVRARLGIGSKLSVSFIAHDESLPQS